MTARRQMVPHARDPVRQGSRRGNRRARDRLRGVEAIARIKWGGPGIGGARIIPILRFEGPLTITLVGGRGGLGQATQGHGVLVGKGKTRRRWKAHAVIKEVRMGFRSVLCVRSCFSVEKQGGWGQQPKLIGLKAG